MKFVGRIAILGMLVSMTCAAQTKKSGGGPDISRAKLERMPESLEVRYALSAAPPHLRDAATTYVLDPSKGYLLHHRGTNGVSCIVVRSDWQWPGQPFRDDIAWPVCFDAEGSKTLLQDYIYTAELRARGMDAKRVHLEVTKKFGSKEYPNPSRAGVASPIRLLMRCRGTVTVTKQLREGQAGAPAARVERAAQADGEWGWGPGRAY